MLCDSPTVVTAELDSHRHLFKLVMVSRFFFFGVGFSGPRTSSLKTMSYLSTLKDAVVDMNTRHGVRKIVIGVQYQNTSLSREGVCSIIAEKT